MECVKGPFGEPCGAGSVAWCVNGCDVLCIVRFKMHNICIYGRRGGRGPVGPVYYSSWNMWIDNITQLINLM